MTLYLEENLDLPLKEILPIIQKRIMTKTSYFGVKTLKNPLDHWVYQEIIFEQRPEFIIEIGNNRGGSTLALAHFLDACDKGTIIAIDIDQSKIPEIVRNHPRIIFIEAPALEAIEQVDKIIGNTRNTLVIEDSSHTYQHTLDVLRQYQKFVPQHGYFIVEDSICHHGLDVGPNPGPFEAVVEFVSEKENFYIDREKESFFITWNPKGFLRKK